MRSLCTIAVALALSALVFADVDPPPLRHVASHTVAEVDRTRVIAFELTEPATRDRTLDCVVDRDDLLEVVRAPEVLAGSSIGFVRVRGLAAGVARLSIAGRALDVDVVAPRGAIAPDVAPVIVGPASGAFAWGAISVGVELRETDPNALRDVRLVLPTGERIEPADDTGLVAPPIRTVRFELDVDRLDAGPLALRAVAIDAAGKETSSAPCVITVLRPDDVFGAEAETPFDVERPNRFPGREQLPIGRQDDASGGAFYYNSSAYPALCIPVEVDRDGWYQIALVAGATVAQGALPTVGIVLDDEQEARTNTRLLDTGWHRILAGLPIRLTAGAHVVTPYFANDFYAPQLADRNLAFDRFEIARVADAQPATDAAPSSMSMMSMSMGMGGASAVGPARVSDPMGTGPSLLRVGFGGPFDDTTAPGTFVVRANAWHALDSVVPDMTLYVNDTPHSRQRTRRANFLVDPADLEHGENRLHIVASLPDGTTATTVSQRVRRASIPGETARVGRRFHRFTMHEDGWDDVARERRRNQHGDVYLALNSNTEVTLDLPDELEGSFELDLEGDGDDFGGPPIGRVRLTTNGETTDVGETEVTGGRRRAGTVHLARGTKTLHVAFINDRYEAGVGDRNMRLRSVTLVGPAPNDAVAPVVEIAWPADGHDVWQEDVVVIHARDDHDLARIRLVIDGAETGMDINRWPGMPGSLGPAVLPLLTRDLAPGAHELVVAVTDRAGNETRSEPRSFVVADEAPHEPGAYARAVFLASRLGYGPDPRELAAILTMGEDAWLDDRLRAGLGDPAEVAAIEAALPWFPNASQYETPRRALTQLLLTPNPVRARLVMWMQNHFSTWVRKTQGELKWDEHLMFAELGATSFDRLLRASAESPAMLTYLDQARSFSGQLNENYARELLELHTLGVDGGYVQRDVTRLAGVLTGWTVTLQGDGRGGGRGATVYDHRYDPTLSDGSATRLLGLALPEADPDAPLERIDLVLETLAAHPSTAQFVARKLAEHYVRVPADDTLVDDLADTFLISGGDLSEMVRTLAAHDVFWASIDEPRFAQPLEYALRLCRTSRHLHPWLVGDFLQRSGAGLFDRSTPDGYPEEDVAYADSNAMVQRWRLAQDCLHALAGMCPATWRYTDQATDEAWAQRVVDSIAVRLTGHQLGERSNTVAVDMLTRAEGTTDQRVQNIATFIAQLPEANLR